MQNKKLVILDREIRIQKINGEDYICLSDIARYRDPVRVNYLVQNWMRNRFTLDFIGLWEKLSNKDFKCIEFEAFRLKSGDNSFVLTPKLWILKTNAIGIISKEGRYGGTYAHRDIAFEFASWISPEFKLYLIKEFQRLKEIEVKTKDLDWDFKRNLAKINYKIHTETIRRYLIPQKIKPDGIIYSTEADVLNLALFGITAKEYRKQHKVSLRDNATPGQLICLSNLESLNSVFIKQGLSQKERLVKLNNEAIYQMKILEDEKEMNKKLILKERLVKYRN